MRLGRVTIVLLVVLLLGALVVPGAMAKKDGKLVPLKGDFAGVGEEFSGNFSHLGRFEGQVTSSNPPEAAATWTAASGDEVYNTSLFIITGGTAPVFTYEQEILIVGGTGRFVCAEGEATVTGTIDFITGAYDGHLEGVISQPNKKAVCPPDDDLPPGDDF